MAKRVPESEAASETEVEEAIRRLTPDEHVKLLYYGRLWAFRAGRRFARGRTAEDLLGDALTDTLNGTRNWRKEAVSFVDHLIGVMRSRASRWKKEPEVADSSFVQETEDGERETPIERAVAPELDLDAELDATTLLNAIDELFHGDAVATDIIAGHRCEMTRPEICETLGLSEQQYDTAMKRIRRGAKRLAARKVQ